MADKIKFYTDEHVSPAVVAGLKRRGVDVLTTQAAGMLGASDEDQLSLSTRSGRVIFTQDADFLRLHATGANHAGIAYMSQQASVGEILRGLMLLYQILDPAEMQDHVEFL